MSGGEVFVGLVAGIGAAIYWLWWFGTVLQTNPLLHPGRRLIGVALILLICLALVTTALVNWADPIVRESPGYILLFLAVAADALAIATAAGSLFGLGAIHDGIRRKCTATLVSMSGLWIGTALASAGANIGRGDTIGTTLGPLAIAVATLLALAALLAIATRRFAAVRLDRDGPAGIRLAGLFIAWGLILGRAAAGDWESILRTWEDFLVYGWPAMVLLIAAVAIELEFRPTVVRPRLPWPAGVGPAAAYVAIASIWVLLR
jgi:hypothetical protein